MFFQTITYKHKQMSKQFKDNFSTCFYNKKKYHRNLTTHNNNNKTTTKLRIGPNF